ncbi:hypothetical protein DdX_13464 [Ditylenchus destructor]|uniref:Retrotransposon gag domain-containing protein n=1 Tax=Ditylenchus destructor TaxID=166010 RepID=A0AAD4MYL7_9BILA|nr:hypothetical protein DdX_13464 [Ditylenchus destructor]
MVLTKALITTQRTTTIFNSELLSKSPDSQPITHRDLAALPGHAADLKKRNHLAQTELGVQEFRVVTPEENQGIKLGDFDSHPSTLQHLLAQDQTNEPVSAVHKNAPILDHSRGAYSELQLPHNDDSEYGDYPYGEEFYVEVFEIGENISPFNGEGDTSFSEWLVRFQDLADAQTIPWNGVQKLNKLKFMLEGIAREKFEQLTVAEKGNYDSAVIKLTSFFENSMTRNIARQGLRNCRQIKGEPVRAFMTRLKRIVTASTVGQGDQMFQQVLLDEFLDRLEPILRFHVKTSQPSTVEEALNKALHLEHLIEAQRVAKQEEIEEIAGIVRATIQDSQHLQDDTGFALHHEVQVPTKTYGHGHTSQSPGGQEFYHSTNQVDPNWGTLPNSEGRTNKGWNGGWQSNLHQSTSGQIDPVEQVIRDMAEKLAFEAQANTTLRHIYPNYGDFLPDSKQNGD